MKGLLRWLRATPFTSAVMLATLLVHVLGVGMFQRVPRTLAQTWGFQPGDLLGGNAWNALTTVFLNTSGASMVLALAVLGLALGLAEFTVGTRRAALLFLLSQLAAVVLYALMVGSGSPAGIDWPAGTTTATLLGPFAASTGALMAASRGISLLWRRRVRVLVLATAVMLSVYVGHAQHMFILISAVAGLLLGLLLVPAAGHGVAGRSTSREIRTNMAMVVAVFAIGPLAAALAHVPVGPLAILRTWITSQNVTVSMLPEYCARALACHDGEHNLGLLGPGSHLLALVPMVLLLVCAEGLRRGNRLALWAGVYLHLLIGVASAIYFQVFAGVGLTLRRGHRSLSISESVWELLPVVLAPVVISVLLLVFHRHFRVDPDPVLRRRAFVVVPIIMVVFVAAYSVAWFAEDNMSANPLGAVALLASIPRLVLPYPYPFNYSVSIYPQGLIPELMFSFGGPVLWFVSAGLVLGAFLSRRNRSGADDWDRAKGLVQRGGDSLSWMALWPNNQYWFNAKATAGIAYQVHGGVAVTVGGPVGDPADHADAIAEFLDYCSDESMTACFYSVNEGTAGILSARGLRSIPVAQETLLDVRRMEFKGKDWQNVRTALNKAGKLGIAAIWCSYSELTTSQRTQVHEISEDWVSGQALPELGFTLGGLEQLKDPHVLLCLAIDDTGRVHAVTSWLPVHLDGEVVSWTLDFMRRNSGAFNGVMEFLVAQAVGHFAASVDYISLSGSPLAASDEAEGAMARLLSLLARTLEPVYGFASLANFKQRFKPRHRPLVLMYADPLTLPAIARAVAEAYMPSLSLRSVARVLHK